MAHFAKINSNNIVTDVFVINNDVIKDSTGNEQESLGVTFCTQIYGAGIYKQTSYNSNIRKNMATVGSTYDSNRDAFIRPKRYPSWVLDEDTCMWKAPIKVPSDDKQYSWDESSKSWNEIKYT